MVCVLDEIMMALADEHRRQLLAVLAEENAQPVQTPEGVQLDGEKLEDIQVELCHNHLPRLEDAGFIEWNQKQHVVSKGPEFDQIEPVLELFEENVDELPVKWP